MEILEKAFKPVLLAIALAAITLFALSADSGRYQLGQFRNRDCTIDTKTGDVYYAVSDESGIVYACENLTRAEVRFIKTIPSKR